MTQHLTWLPPTDVEAVTYYAVYMADSSTGANRIQVGNVSVTDNETSVRLPAQDRAIENSSFAS